MGRGKGERERREVIDGPEDLEAVGRDGIDLYCCFKIHREMISFKDYILNFRKLYIQIRKQSQCCFR